MTATETREGAFKRLATKRTNRALKDISLIGNLADKRNYSFNKRQVDQIFRTVDAELRDAKARFRKSLRTVRRLEL